MRKKTVCLLVACIFISSFTAGGVLAQSVSFESNLGGSARYGLIDGTKLYSLIGSSLYIADISNMSTPLELGRLALPGTPRRIAQSGTTLYISCTTGGLVAVDVTTPAKPKILSATTFDKVGTIGQTFGVAVKGNYVYAADYNGVFVLDMTNPAAPVQVGSFTAFEKEHPNTYDAYINGTTLYVCCEMDGLYIFDISVPTTLNKISHYPGQYYCSLRDGNYLYVAAGGPGFEILDISDIAHPQHVSILNHDYQGILELVKAADGYVYLCSEMQNFYKIDVSDKANPKQVSEFVVLGNHSLGISTTGNYVVLANSNYGIRIFDTQSATIQQVGQYLSLGRVVDCKGEGSLAYAAVGLKGLAVINVANPALPLQVTQKPLRGYANGLAVAGSTVYVAETNHEGEEGGLLEIVDVTYPSTPVILGSVALDGQPYSVQVQGNLALVACQTTGVAIVDIADTSRPKLLGTYDTSGVCYAPQLWGDYILAADGIRGFTAIDIKDPTYPKKIAGNYDLGNVVDIALWDTWLYLPAISVLHMANFDPLYLPVIDDATISPVTDGRNQTGQLKAVTAFNGYLLVADSIGGVRLFDIAQQDSPQEFAGKPTFSGDPLRIAYAATAPEEGIAYMSSGIAGVYIYKVGDLQKTPDLDANGIWAGEGTEGTSTIGIVADLYQAHATATGTLTIYGATVVTGQVTATVGSNGHLTGTILYADGTSGTVDFAKSGSTLTGSISGGPEITGISLAYVTSGGLLSFENTASTMQSSIKSALASAKGMKKRQLTRAQKMMTAAVAQSVLDRQLGLSGFAVAMIGPRAAAGMIPAAEALLYQSALWEAKIAQAETAVMAAAICADYKKHISFYQSLGDLMLDRGKKAGERNMLARALSLLSNAASNYKLAADYYKENAASCPTWGEAEFNGYYEGVIDFGIISAGMKICAAQAEDGTLSGAARLDVEATGEHMSGRIADAADLADNAPTTDPNPGVCPSDVEGECTSSTNITVGGISKVNATILIPLGNITAHVYLQNWQYNAKVDQWEGGVQIHEQASIKGTATVKKKSDICPDGFPNQ